MANKKKPATKKKSAKKAAKKKLAAKRRTRTKDQLRQENWAKGIVVALLSLIVLVMVGSLMMLAYAWWYDNRQVPSAETVQAVAKVEPEIKSGFLDPEDPENQQRFDELRVFWEEVLSFMIQDQILKGRVSVPSISQRILGLQDKIIRRYGKPHDIDVILNYSETGNRKVQAESGVRKDKTPIMMIQVAAIEDFYNELQASGAPFVQQMFFNKMIISIEHELDHLAISLMTELQSADGRALTTQEKVDGEAEVWHYSCLYVIEPMIVNSQPVDDRMLRVYQAWVRSGKQASSESWKSYIKQEKVTNTRN